MSTAPRRLGRRLLPLGAALGASALLLTACGPAEGGTSNGSGGTGEFTYFGQTENTTIIGTLESLAKDQCADANEAAPLKSDSIPGSTWDQQLQLLAGQDGLSNFGMAAGTPSLMNEFIDAGQVLNLSEELEKLGVENAILPAAESTVKALYGRDDVYALPTEFNIEGFWYNKQLLEENGVEVPTTWSELADAVDALAGAGVQPLAAAGKDGWPITRLVGNYILRDLGPDALQKVADGDASLTDPEYVAGAEAVAELGAAGGFGDAVGSIDYNGAMNQFLTGEAAFFYMGSWALGNFNDPEQNQIGAENIGFLPFPAVDGGAGSADQVPANVGIPTMFSTANYDEETTGAWVKCIVENYGEVAFSEFGVVPGLPTGDGAADTPELTKTVQEVIETAPSSVLWFEAHFTPEATTVSQQSGGALATGQVSPADFMQSVQSANEG